MELKRLLLALCLVMAAAHEVAASRGVVNDPDGFTNLRAARSRESAIVAKAKNGEQLDFDYDANGDWWEVTLRSGKKGYMHSSRIRLHRTSADLRPAPLNDEIHLAARSEGLDFYPVARAAAKGDPAAMKRFFDFRSDGAAGEMHDAAFVAVTHMLGDEKLATFLNGQPGRTRTNVRESFEGSNELLFDAQPYLQRHFPKTASLLFR